MTQRSKSPRHQGGQAWVWAADGLGLGLLASLTAAAAGAPALAHIHSWLMLALPLAGLVAFAAAERRPVAVPVAAPVADRVVARRTIVITPRPGEARRAEK